MLPMKIIKLSSNAIKSGQLLPLLWFFVSLLFAVLAGSILFNSALIGSLSSTIINIGLDPLRAQLTAALIMAAGTALIGTLLGQRKPGAILGTGIVFWFSYLADFIALEQRPVYDPGGRIEPLNNAALLHTSLVIIALGLLSAFIGSAVGSALAETLLMPPYRLIRFAWQRMITRPRQSGVRELPLTALSSRSTLSLPTMIFQWLGIALMIVLLVLASGSGDLFLFSPDVGLHILPRYRAQGTLVDGTLISKALGGQKRSFIVYLPPSYNTPQGRTKRYPVLYLLHGTPGRPVDWLNGGQASQSTNTLIATGKIPELLLVIPDGNGRPGATPEWGNSYDRRQLLENFVATDLVQYVDQRYRTIPDAAHRAIAGLSMGGFGAMNIAIHHPDIFGTTISLGGYYRAEGNVWGKSPAYRQANSPAYTILNTPQAARLHIYLGAATKDQPYYNDTKQFAQELTKLRIPYRFDLQIGYHSWHVWQVQIYNALTWLKWS